MTLYAIFSKPENGPEAIRAVGERFVWSAFLFTPLWAGSRGAFGLIGLWALVVIALYLGAPHIGQDTALWLYSVFALWCGFAAPAVDERLLLRAGWIDHGTLVAPDTQAAELAWLNRIYGRRP